MNQLSIYFVTALKTEVERGPRGTRAKLARLANVAPGQVTDILNGRKYGSEETKRALAAALGWDYEELLKYGKCLVEGTEYKRPVPQTPVYDPSLYLAVPFHNKIIITATPEGNVPIPDYSENNSPLILYKPLLGQYAKNNHLVALSMNDDSMEPTLPQNSVAIVDTSDRTRCDGKLFAVSQSLTAGKYMIKRLRQDGDDTYLTSDNNAYPPKLIKQHWDSIVVGRIIWSWLPHV